MMNFDEQEFEQLKPEFLVDPDLWMPPINLSCLTLPGFRAYATADFGKLQVFPGITSILDQTTDQSWKCDWYGQVGLEEAIRKLKEGQWYGTLLHGQTARFDIEKSYNFDATLFVVNAFSLSHPLPFPISIPAQAQKLQEDMLSYITWYQNVEFEPFGVEVQLLSQTICLSFNLTKQSLENLRKEGIPDNILEDLRPLENQEFTNEEKFLNAVEKQIGNEQTALYKDSILKHALQIYGVASRVDKFGMMTIGEQGFYVSGKNKGKPKGEPRRVFVIVDIKSSRKCNSNPSYPLQLLFYDQLLKENYPSLQDKEFLLYNWNPKGWESGPDYKFTDQTGKASLEELEMCIKLFYLRHSWKKNRIRIFGTYSLKDEASELTAHLRKESYLELLAQELATELPDELREAVL